MKIGIFTFHRAHNYGAMLQTYALKKVCEKLENNTYVIDYAPNYIDSQYRYFTLSKSMKSNLLKLLNLTGNIKKKKKFEEFKNTYFSLIPFQTEQKFDILLYGSDQIWNPNIKGDFDSVYFGLHNIKVNKNIAYAASIGKSDLSDEEKKDISKLLDNLYEISVREETAKNVLKPLTDKNISVVLDPTLLLTSSDWSEIAIKPNIDTPYILVYEVNKITETMNIARELSKKTGFKIIEIAYYKTKIHCDHKILNGVGPREFLGLFQEANYVVTSSFHGTAFSIINRKNFYTVAHRAYGSRMVDLLNNISLSDRLVESLPDTIIDVDYSSSEKILNQWRNASIDFLTNSWR